jgi:tRNA-splicing ligase RtcB (3'-phosphate/5'-hydroxy nucleic acid ligase)
MDPPKGAIAAPAEEWALIPGSMGTASYLVMGRGEPLSFRSSSDGAGRVVTRREARENIKPARFHQSMRRVVYDELRSRALLEEASFAYRDLMEVLGDEADLVTPLIRLEPIVVLKG